VAIAWCLGLRLLSHLNLEDLGFLVCNNLVGPSRCDGCGCKKIEPDRPWAAFQIQVHPSVKAFFAVAIISKVGNGKNTIFWMVRWLHGQSLAQLVPNLYGSVSARARKRTVFEAMTNMRWV
jgi:hypothetical protein